MGNQGALAPCISGQCGQVLGALVAALKDALAGRTAGIQAMHALTEDIVHERGDASGTDTAVFVKGCQGRGEYGSRYRHLSPLAVAGRADHEQVRAGGFPV